MKRHYIDSQRGPKEELGPFPKLKTPLHTAARVGNINIVKILLENGVSADVACERGLISPLLWLCEKSDPDLDVVRSLIQKGANTHAIDPEEGRTALHFATRSVHATLAEILLESGAEVNTTSFNGDLPIHEAIYNNNLNVVKVLITYGSSLSKKDSSGRTPLKIAIDHANQELISVLIAAGGKIEQEDNESEMNNGPRTPRDQFEVFWILQNKCTQSPMASWLVLRILDMAEYWVKVEVKRSESVRVDQRRNPNGMVYLMTDPLPGRMKSPVRAIQFTTFSHDQGWSDYPQSHGSYHNTWTWFKAVIEEKDCTRIPIEGEDGLL
ncbi:hypothetical protein N7488_004753 [Penicillium malachiteum]|nr:hypothetical protein N7488_004753 [Penicillium malachiteum]